MRYNRRTNEFGLGHPNGTVSTFYHPDDGLDYWLAEKAKYTY